MDRFFEAWIETIQTFHKDPTLWITGLKQYLKISDEPTANLMRERLSGNCPLEWTQSNVDHEIEVLKFVSAGAGKGFLDKIPDDLFVKPSR